MRTLKREEIYVTKYRDLEHLHSNLGEFIEQYYTVSGLHSALGYRSPEESSKPWPSKTRTEPQGGKPGCCPPWEKSSPGLLGNRDSNAVPFPRPQPLLGRTEESYD